MGLIHKRIDNIPIEDKNLLRSIYMDVLEKSYESRVDEKNENSWSRQASYKSTLEALEICLNNKANWTMIYRDMTFIKEESYWDLGACTMGLKCDVFLWAKVTDENAKLIFEKYNLNIDNYGA